MTITWFGQSCFRIETKEDHSTRSTRPQGGEPVESTGSGQVNILIDPFSRDIGLRPPKIKDNIVLVSHHHYDHDNVSEVSSETFIIDGPGEYEKQGISVVGIQSFHDKSGGKERGLNTIYVIKAEDVTICHMGDFGQEKFEEHQLEDIGDIDILMIPVGGVYTINYKEAVNIISQIEPKVIIPMHYKIKDLKIDLEGPDKFLKEIGLTPEKTDKLKITKKTLPTEEMKLVIFSS